MNLEHYIVFFMLGCIFGALVSRRGPKGDRGEPGSRGFPGPVGLSGKDGRDGVDGVDCNTYDYDDPSAYDIEDVGRSEEGSDQNKIT